MANLYRSVVDDDTNNDDDHDEINGSINKIDYKNTYRYC
jgi:hypothetical protein